MKYCATASCDTGEEGLLHTEVEIYSGGIGTWKHRIFSIISTVISLVNLLLLMSQKNISLW